MVLAVPNISALIRILNLTCLLANGQHQIFEKWREWFRTWKLTVGQKAGQVQDPNQCKEIWRNSFALFIVNWHRWFIELMWGNAQMYICICICMSIYVCIYAYIYIQVARMPRIIHRKKGRGGMGVYSLLNVS